MSTFVVEKIRARVSRGNYVNMFAIHGAYAVWELPSSLKIL